MTVSATDALLLIASGAHVYDPGVRLERGDGDPGEAEGISDWDWSTSRAARFGTAYPSHSQVGCRSGFPSSS